MNLVSLCETGICVPHSVCCVYCVHVYTYECVNICVCGVVYICMCVPVFLWINEFSYQGTYVLFLRIYFKITA